MRARPGRGDKEGVRGVELAWIHTEDVKKEIFMGERSFLRAGVESHASIHISNSLVLPRCVNNMQFKVFIIVRGYYGRCNFMLQRFCFLVK